MAFKSKAHMDKMKELVAQGKISQKDFNKHLKATPHVKLLPARLHKKKNS